mmetsp:Transcript_6121/g.17699  ORF Transcript_6121/g.17699 Transcript_6121/m.17699 type:complete len:324 (+) Transcript_6121:160-1131(+)
MPPREDPHRRCKPRRPAQIRCARSADGSHCGQRAASRPPMRTQPVTRCHKRSAASIQGCAALGGGAAATAGVVAWGCRCSSRALRKRVIADLICPSTWATAALLFSYWASALSWAFCVARSFAVNSASLLSNCWTCTSAASGLVALTFSNSAFAFSKSSCAFFCSAAIAVSSLNASFLSFSNSAVFCTTAFLHSATACSNSLTFCCHSTMDLPSFAPTAASAPAPAPAPAPTPVPFPKPSKPFNFFSARSRWARASSAALRAASAAAAASAAFFFSASMSRCSPASRSWSSSASFCAFLAMVLRRSYLDCASHSPLSEFSSLT